MKFLARKHLSECVLGACAFVFMGFSTTGFAKELGGISMDDTVTVEGKTLQLNGMGLRKALGVVKVYVGGLYLETKSRDPQVILASPEVKQLHMKFIYEVEPEKMRENFVEGFKNNCTEKCDEAKVGLEQLNKWMTPMKLKDSIIFRFLPEKVMVNVKGQDKGEIAGAPFAKALLGVYLGPKPPTESLKEGLLGKD